MTKDDAIAILQGVARYLMSGNEILYSDKLMLALDMAIDALKEVKNQNEELNNSNESSLTQNALDTISRQKAIDAVDKALTRVFVEHRDIAEKVINKIPSAQPEPSDAVYRLYKRAYEAGQRNAQPEIVRCKECKYFEYEHLYVVQDIPVIGHLVCNKWGDGCRTDENGFCFMGERRTDECVD